MYFYNPCTCVGISCSSNVVVMYKLCNNALVNSIVVVVTLLGHSKVIGLVSIY